jgi:alkylation response protein AidB-like acyl-CoA dehydrogenase
MGIRGSSTCPIVLENATVPAINLLGEAGKGHQIAFNTLNLGRIKLGAGTIGACKYALELSTRYARERMQFGRTIGSFGLVATKLAEMALLAFVGETMVYRTTGLLDDLLARAASDAERVGAIEELSVEASIVKVFGSEALDFCADEAVQIHGGYGFVEDYQVERLLRDSRINRIFEGTNEINRLIVPGTILKRALRGQIPLLDDVSRIRDGIAKGEVPRSADRSNLAVAAQVAELSKWVSLYVLAVAAETYHVKVADEQEVLGELADMITRVYAIDSVVARVQKIAHGTDEDRSTLANDLLMAFVPPAFSRIVHTGRHVLMDICEGSALSTHLAAIDKLRIEWPCKVIAAKRRIAAAVLERGGYPL